MNRLSKVLNHFQSSSQELLHQKTSNDSIRRIVRFYEHCNQSQKGYDDTQTFYGVLNDDQSATVGTVVSLLNYNNIHDSNSYSRSNNSKRIGKIMTPIDPTNVFCVGLNYKFHAKESEMKIPEYPVIFSKPTSAIISTNEDIIIPKVCDKGINESSPGEVDYEVELVIVIGKKCKNVSEMDALNYVLGYSIANDVSARHWQLYKGGSQWIRGKSFDTFCPFGPCILMEDNKNINAQNLNLYTNLNGKTVQNSNTKEMIFPIRKLVSFLSESTTLLPGTIILSGTPDGVGFVRKPPIWLKNGDNVIVSVEGIGDLINNVKDE
eukprot:85856_1